MSHADSTAHSVPLQIQARDLFRRQDAVVLARSGAGSSIRAGEGEAGQEQRVFGQRRRWSGCERESANAAGVAGRRVAARLRK